MNVFPPFWRLNHWFFTETAEESQLPEAWSAYTSLYVDKSTGFLILPSDLDVL